MPREDLVRAAEHLSTAAEAADTEATASTLRDLADQLDRLAERERPPDHGRLARIQRHYGDLRADSSTDAQDAIDRADDNVNAYRETIEGV